MPDRSNIPVKMQGKYGSCGGHAGAMFESIIENTDLSPKYLWKLAKNLYAQSSDTELYADTGVDMRSIFKAMQNTGVCHESVCPDVLDPSFQQYTDVAAITAAVYNDAYPYGVTNYAFTDNPTWDEIRQAIYQNGAVIALVDCGDGWWANGWGEQATCPLKLGNYASGHFICLWGYDEKYIYFRNSWSSAWGRNGDGYFDVSYLPHVREIGVGIAAPSTKQKLVSLYQELIYALEQEIPLLRKAKAN
jgi:C1A family cysteine protease